MKGEARYRQSCLAGIGVKFRSGESCPHPCELPLSHPPEPPLPLPSLPLFSLISHEAHVGGLLDDPDALQAEGSHPPSLRIPPPPSPSPHMKLM